MDRTDRGLTAEDVLRRYREEDLPAFAGGELDHVNRRGIFGEHPLDVAAGRGIVEEVQALLDGGAAIDAHGELGNTALHEAVVQGHADVVRLLLECGASRTERNDAGATALDLARLLGRTDLVGLLTSLDEPTGLPTRAPAIATREHP